MSDPNRPTSTPGTHPTEPIVSSGNRWEPTAAADGEAPAGPPPAASPAATATLPPPPAAPPVAPGYDPGYDPGPVRRSPLANRNALTAGIAAAALVLVGAGGFLLGRATADGGDGFPGDRSFQGPQQPGGFGAPGQAPGQQQGQLPGQQQGQQGQLPGQPGQGLDDD